MAKRRNKFNLSYYNMLSCKMGYLVPVGLTELLPGDSIQLSHSMLMRLAPMLAPVMHPVHCTIQSFFVPHRIVWDDFEDFITGGPDGMDASVPPTVTVTPQASSLADYLGLPIGNALSVSALPFRGYSLIWNEYYRDQDLQTEIPISTSSGVDTTSNTILKKVDWSKDYFTTARPWPQKGVGITVPVDSTVAGQPSLSFSGRLRNGNILYNYDFGPRFEVENGISDINGNGPLNVVLNRGTQSLAINVDSEVRRIGLAPAAPGNLFVADPSVDGTVSYVPGSPGIGSIDINLLREAFAMQRFEEQRALYGSRYEDYLRQLGVRPRDARLQMPEYLGGSTRTVQFSEVLQTGGDTVGQLFGHGIAALGSGRIRYFAPEHGFLFSLLFIRPIPVYSQGVERFWSRQTKEDYWQKGFEHIGQQQVKNKEIYATGSAADDQTFGWQNRYDEYRRGKNHIAGEFKTTQDYWHMARIFTGLPALNSDFVEANPTDRIFQATEQNSDQLYCMVQNRLIARRFVSKNGNPI